MSNIEPTEDQKQAAEAFIVARLLSDDDDIPHLARLLAEREAKLREEVARLEALCTEEARLIVERDTLRARVAELEAEVSESTRLRMTETLHGMGVEAMYQEREAQHLARIAELEAKAANLDARLWDRCEDLARVGLERVHADAVHSKREAQHLADIKALMADAFHRHVACVGGCSVCDLNSGARCSLMQRLAHYDDAKADAGAVSPEMDAMLTKALEAVDARASQSDEEWAKGVAPFIVADLDEKAAEGGEG